MFHHFPHRRVPREDWGEFANNGDGQDGRFLSAFKFDYVNATGAAPPSAAGWVGSQTSETNSLHLAADEYVERVIVQFGECNFLGRFLCKVCNLLAPSLPVLQDVEVLIAEGATNACT